MPLSERLTHVLRKAILKVADLRDIEQRAREISARSRMSAGGEEAPREGESGVSGDSLAQR